jgi:hypothetical protein
MTNPYWTKVQLPGSAVPVIFKNFKAGESFTSRSDSISWFTRYDCSLKELRVRRKEDIKAKTVSLVCVKIGKLVKSTIVQRFVELGPNEIMPLGAYVRECDGQYECGAARETDSDGGWIVWEFDFSECPLNEALGTNNKL